MRCGSGEAYRSLASRSAESFLWSARGAAAREAAAAAPPAATTSSAPPPAARKARRERRRSSMPLSCRSENVMSDRVGFLCNGAPVNVVVAPGESLLSVLRERLGIVSAKDGCAPQGQCGCCTVLVDGEPRVACVTPVVRVSGRHVTTVEGLDAPLRDELASRFVASGGSQCGFCTPGIVVRAAALHSKNRTSRTHVDRALAAHLCRCTGWQTVYDAIEGTAHAGAARDGAARRASLEGGVTQQVGSDIPLGAGGFADDTAPRDALVAVPLPPGSDAPSFEAAGARWVVADSLWEARTTA